MPKKEESEIEWDGKGGSVTEMRVSYEFIPGPFTEIYVKACDDPGSNYFLIIEEINRAKAASVFGDIFQLMDRDKDGKSDYFITPDKDLNNYLKAELGNKYNEKMQLPVNLYIWATMNSADQGVFPLDSAFKRRWSQLYMDINSPRGDATIKVIDKSGNKSSVLWDNLRHKINRMILKAGFDEDRCLGAWYFKDEEIAQINGYMGAGYEDRATKPNPFVDKLMYYLRQDLFRMNPSFMFQKVKDNDEERNITMSDIRRNVIKDTPLCEWLKIDELEPATVTANYVQTAANENSTNDTHTTENKDTATDVSSDKEQPAENNTEGSAQ